MIQDTEIFINILNTAQDKKTFLVPLGQKLIEDDIDLKINAKKFTEVTCIYFYLQK